MPRAKVEKVGGGGAAMVGRGLCPRRMRDSGVAWIGAIPKGWRVNYLFQVVSQVKERNEDLKETNLLSLSYGKIKRKSIETIGGLLPASFDGYNIIENNDIVLRLTDLQNDQHSLRVGIARERGIITSAYITIRPSTAANPDFLFHSLFAFDVMKGFYGMGAGVRQGLNYDEVKQIKILLPPLPVQCSIANHLNTQCAEIDGAIASARQSIEDYKALKKSLIFEVVTGKRKVGEGSTPRMRDSGNVLIGDIPAEWEMLPLRRLGNLANGISKGGECFGSGYPFVSYSDVFKNDVLPATVKGLVESDEEDRSRYSVRRGDVLFTRTSETVDEIGIAAACLTTIPQSTFAGFLIRFRPSSDKLLPEFSRYYFRNKSVSEFFAKELCIVTRASLGQERLKSLPVLVPSLKEQKAIAKYLDEKCGAIDALVAEKESLIADLETYKKSLIFEVVTGKREVA